VRVLSQKVNPAVRGAVALVRRGTCYLETKAANAAAAGAVGIIIYNNVPSPWDVYGGVVSSIPVVFVLQSDGLAMRSAMRAHLKVTAAFSQHTQAREPLLHNRLPRRGWQWS
jgi:PA domain